MRHVFIGIVALLIAASPAAYAAEVFGNSTTLAYFHEDTILGDCRTGECQMYLALYEFLDAGALDAGMQGLDFYVSAWGRLDTMDEEGFDKSEMEPDGIGDAELDTAYVQWVEEEGWVEASLGRRFVHVGPVAERLDGALAVFRPLPWLGLTAFGGVPAVSDVGERDGDFGYGGRVFGGLAPYFEVGASFADFFEESELDRRRIGGDLRVSPIRQLDLFGHGYVDLLQGFLYDADARAIARPIENLELSAGFSRVVPTAFLGMNSIFTVFTYETVNKASAVARYVLLSRYELEAEYDHLDYIERDPADRMGGSFAVRWGLTDAGRTGAGAYFLDTNDAFNNWEVRVFTYQDLPARLFAALDASITWLCDGEGHPEETDYGTFSFGWKTLDSLSVQGSAVYLNSPIDGERLSGLMKITYEFDRTF